MKKNIKIYTTSWCGPCKSAKQLLKERGCKVLAISDISGGYYNKDSMMLLMLEDMIKYSFHLIVATGMFDYLGWNMCSVVYETMK